MNFVWFRVYFAMHYTFSPKIHRFLRAKDERALLFYLPALMFDSQPCHDFADVMTQDSNQIDPGDHVIYPSKGHLSDEVHADSSKIFNLRIQDLERRIQHLEKVIQRQIRLGRMVE